MKIIYFKNHFKHYKHYLKLFIHNFLNIFKCQRLCMKCNIKFTYHEDLILHEKQIHKKNYMRKLKMFLNKLKMHFIKKSASLKILRKNKQKSICV